MPVHPPRHGPDARWTSLGVLDRTPGRDAPRSATGRSHRRGRRPCADDRPGVPRPAGHAVRSGRPGLRAAGRLRQVTPRPLPTAQAVRYDYRRCCLSRTPAPCARQARGHESGDRAPGHRQVSSSVAVQTTGVFVWPTCVPPWVTSSRASGASGCQVQEPEITQRASVRHSFTQTSIMR